MDTFALRRDRERNTLLKIISEADRIIKSGGLIVLTENMSDKKDNIGGLGPWSSIKPFFDYVDLKHCSGYHDLDERIFVMVGRKNIQQ